MIKDLTMKPSQNIIHQEKIFSQIKLVADENLPERFKIAMEFAHRKVQEMAKKTWDCYVELTQKNKLKLTGDDHLCVLTTLICNLSTNFIANMFLVAEDDPDAGRTKKEIISYVMQGIQSAFENKIG